MAFANVEEYAYSRKDPSESSDWVGKLYKDGAATVLGTVGNWTYIQSGSVTGYVLSDQVYTGGAAKEYASQAANQTATCLLYTSRCV